MSAPANGSGRRAQALMWLRPGMHVKRWLVVLLIGVVLLALGVAYLLREAYLTYRFPGVFYYLTIQFLPRVWRGLLFLLLALGAIGTGLWKLSAALLKLF